MGARCDAIVHAPILDSMCCNLPLHNNSSETSHSSSCESANLACCSAQFHSLYWIPHYVYRNGVRKPAGTSASMQNAAQISYLVDVLANTNNLLNLLMISWFGRTHCRILSSTITSLDHTSDLQSINPQTRVPQTRTLHVLQDAYDKKSVRWLFCLQPGTPIKVQNAVPLLMKYLMFPENLCPRYLTK